MVERADRNNERVNSPRTILWIIQEESEKCFTFSVKVANTLKAVAVQREDGERAAEPSTNRLARIRVGP